MHRFGIQFNKYSVYCGTLYIVTRCYNDTDMVSHTILVYIEIVVHISTVHHDLAPHQYNIVLKKVNYIISDLVAASVYSIVEYCWASPPSREAKVEAHRM